METIGKQELWTFTDSGSKAVQRSCTDIRNGQGHVVRDFWELATKLAELQYRNREHVLLFRGQAGDYRNRNGNSTLKPTLFRSTGTALLPSNALLARRFAALSRAEDALVQRYRDSKLIGIERLERHRILRWTILQHYEICPTPLLDVTHSLRIAASFASHESKEASYLFVLGVPNISGAITASAEAGLQVVRLSSVCPPSALRPHLQEGYLLGEYPEMPSIAQKVLYRSHEIDFGRRLVAKFRFDAGSFWRSEAFPLVEKRALYPSARRDPLDTIAEGIRASLKRAQRSKQT